MATNRREEFTHDACACLKLALNRDPYKSKGPAPGDADRNMAKQTAGFNSEDS